MTSRKDLESDDPHLIFDLSMFAFEKENSDENQEANYNIKKVKSKVVTKITKEANQMDKHLRVLKEGRSELITHPLMKLFMHLKWHSNVVPYFINFLIFLLFLTTFTSHAVITVDFLQCDNHFGNNCKYQFIPDTIY